MATTFIRYKGRLVQVPETPLICIGYMLFHEAWANASTQSEKSRFEQMASDFSDRTTGVGCTDLGLDQMLQGDTGKETEFLSFVNLVRDRLRGFGESIPVEYVNQVIAVGIPEYKDGPVATRWFGRILNIIEALIRDQPIPSGEIWGRS